MTRDVRVVWALRLGIAGLAGGIAGIHIDLWASHGYRSIPTIGALFLLNGVAGSLLALGSLAVPRRAVLLSWIATAGFAATTLAALLVSLNGTLFGFSESTRAPLVATSIVVEALAVAVGAGASLWLAGSLRRARS